MSGQNYQVSQDAFLLEYLFQLFPGQSRTGVKNMLSKGRILVNGESRTAFDLPLKKGDRITVLSKGISIARATRNDARSEVEKAGVQILFEDENYIVVDKPSGMLTVATGKEKKNLYALLNAYIKVNARMQRKEDLLSGREPDRSTAKIWIVHRLDRGTSGVLVFAKNERAKDILQSKWKDLVAERKYIAWLEGRLEKERGAIQSWLAENPKSLKMVSLDQEAPGSQLAITHYRVLSCSRHYTQVEFSLQTGRKNQIRVHAASLEHPVAGDEKYGAQTDPVKRLALHAETLVFRNPFSGKTVRCTSPLPACFEIFEKR